MSTNEIKLKPVRDLLDANFFIPSYQRGYRWTARLVEDLLDDLYDLFFSGNEGFYCLQPLVIKRVRKYAEDDLLEEIKRRNTLLEIKSLIQHNVSYEVIDGQQRLTTLYILLKVLNVDERIFSISYKTRLKSEEYLSKLGESEAENNIDYYFINEAKKKIVNWLNKSNLDKSKFHKNILDRVQFIWYEVADDNPINVFTRLNLGKISLTNAELIKALFFNSSNFGKNGAEDVVQLRQREIAYEWDNIEQTLQNEEFWYFLNHSKAEKSDTRIDFIFDLVAGLKESDVGNYNQYNTFRYFYSAFQNSADKYEEFTTQWEKIKKCFLMLCEWYNDSELYHYVGFWLDQPRNEVKELKEKWETAGNNKLKFIEWLKEDIYNQLSGILKKVTEKEEQPELEIDKRVFRPILLFHNIQSIINQYEQPDNKRLRYRLSPINRFPFYLYKLENWDIEHVNSLTDNKLEKLDDQKTWLKNVKWFVDEQTQTEIEHFLQNAENSSQPGGKQLLKFEELRSKCCLKTDNHWEEYEKNSLGNYVLLDSSTNRSYKNQIFPVKRKIIMAIDSGIPNEFTGETVHRKFVPPCTKLVFMKYFSEKPNTAEDINYWTKEDANWYLADIKKCLDKIKPVKKGKNNG